jgi:endonuclease/exonuclease/phosphatase family metal-dependent hydrolase
MHVLEEQYGDAILTAWPSTLIKGAALPGIGRYQGLEPRGALWAAVQTPDGPLQIITTHFGLLPPEQRIQAEALLGPDWLGHAECTDPVVLMGDFNALPGTRPHRALTGRLTDAQSLLPRRARATFPARRPFLRIDHIFTSAGLAVEGGAVAEHGAARVASDHLPLMVDIALTASLGRRQARQASRISVGSPRCQAAMTRETKPSGRGS